jgi:hypothetical protein
LLCLLCWLCLLGLLRQALVQSAAGLGRQRLDAEFSEHVRGRFHLGRPAHRVPRGAVHDPVQALRVGRGQFGADVLTQPLLVACRPGRLERLDDGCGHALVEDAAQQLLGGREPGRPCEHLDTGSQRRQQGGVPRGAVPAGQHGDTQAPSRNGRHHRHVCERHAAGLGDAGEFLLGARRGGIQVRPQGIRAHPGQPGAEGVHRGLRAVHAQHQVRAPDRLRLAAALGDAGRRGDHGHRGVVAADRGARGQQVTRDYRAGLAEAQHRDD